MWLAVSIDFVEILHRAHLQEYLLINVVHCGYIEKYIERLGERYNIREIAFDRWDAVQMVQNLEGMGFTVVPMGQGFASMSPPTKEPMKLTLEKNWLTAVIRFFGGT